MFFRNRRPFYSCGDYTSSDPRLWSLFLNQIFNLEGLQPLSSWLPWNNKKVTPDPSYHTECATMQFLSLHAEHTERDSERGGERKNTLVVKTREGEGVIEGGEGDGEREREC